MTNTTDFISRVETDLHTARKISDATKAVFTALPTESRVAFQHMMAFVGCETPKIEGSYRTNPQDRVNAVVLMFFDFQIDTHDPKWSSWRLEKLLEAVLNTPQGEVIDLIRGFDLALEKYGVRLTETVVNLVKDVVILSFTRARAAYQQANWGWANEELAKGVSPARSYLFLYALPPDKATPAAIVGILRGLADTPYSAQAVDTRSDDLERPDVKPLLRELKLSNPEAVEKLRPYL
jgi:hypothetical protein